MLHTFILRTFGHCSFAQRTISRYAAIMKPYSFKFSHQKLLVRDTFCRHLISLFELLCENNTVYLDLV